MALGREMRAFLWGGTAAPQKRPSPNQKGYCHNALGRGDLGLSRDFAVGIPPPGLVKTTAVVKRIITLYFACNTG